MSWLGRNAKQVEAVAASVTALAAVAALIGVSLQLAEADRLAREQSARASYRGHLALAVAHPQLAAPADACLLLNGPQGGSYVAFIEHLMYSAEQTLDVAEGWEASYLEQLAPHAPYLCAADGPIGETEAVARLLARFRAASCAEVTPCADP